MAALPHPSITKTLVGLLGICLSSFISCKSADEDIAPTQGQEWVRSPKNPVLRDFYSNENYQSASDGHVFFMNDELYMVYSGDANGFSSIKLAKGSSWTNWEILGPVLATPNSAQTDIQKETAFYRRAENGKHQIYYIGYTDDTYTSQIFLAEADDILGPYTQYPTPIVPRGQIADQEVYLITSPSVVAHQGTLYMVFIGWDNNPEPVTQVWIMGATSTDDGHSWSNFKIVDTPIGMEGQLTKTPNGNFVAVRTADYKGEEALFYATAKHPFGPWTSSDTPILSKNGSSLEKDEIIAPQITFDPQTAEEYLFYTGADTQKGWWMMLAHKK